MPRYDFKFVDEDGVPRIVERSFKMGEAPATVRVDLGDASYEAVRVYGSFGVQKSALSEWASDLPPINAPVE